MKPRADRIPIFGHVSISPVTFVLVAMMAVGTLVPLGLLLLLS